MSDFMQFIAAHDVAVGLLGTAVVMLAVVIGFGRRHEAMIAERPNDTAARRSGKV